MEAQRAAHSRFGGSIIERVIECPGSPALCDTVPPSPDTVWSLEGTFAHAVGAYCLREQITDALTLVGTELPFEERARAFALGDGKAVTSTISEDLARAVNVYLDACYDELALSPDPEFWVEHDFDLPTDAAPGEVYGRADFVVYHPSLQRLAVFDYKHGVGVQVPVEGNKQEKFYGAGVLLSLPHLQVRAVMIAIVQPRDWRNSYGRGEDVRRQDLQAVDLFEFIAEVEKAVAAAKSAQEDFGHPVHFAGWLHPSADPNGYCRWCPAAAICGARQAQGFDKLGIALTDVIDLGAAVLPDPSNIDVNKLSDMLIAVDLIESWGAQLRTFVEARLREGTPVPGFKLVNAQSKAKWVDAPDSIAAYLAVAYGLDFSELMPPKLVTITEAERQLKIKVGRENFAAAKEDVRLKFTRKESAGLVMVPASNDREAVDPVAADFATATFNGLESPQ